MRDINDYLTLEEAAVITHYSYNGLYAQARLGKLPCVRKGSMYLIHKDDLPTKRLTQKGADER